MACERFREALTDVAAGAPAPAGLDAHLPSCAACRAELDALRRALALADAEMAGLLSAEPSGELAARIRASVAASPSWRFGWLWPATAAAATLLVALAAWVARAPSPPSRVAVDGPRRALGARVTEPATAQGEALAPRSAGTTGPREVRHAGGSLRTRKVEVPRDSAVPEVLVPSGEAEALQRFATHLQGRTVAPDSLLVADLSAPLPEPEAIAIAPLEIVPLDPAETSGTD